MWKSGGITIKNTFEINGDEVFISIYHPKKETVIVRASLRDDYKKELTSVTWSLKGKYAYSNKLKTYLHIYIMKKWYGEDHYQQMKDSGFIVDHMDNDGKNCCIDNLAFLQFNKNVSKGQTLDKKAWEKSYIALTLFNDFKTQLKQISIAFNYPAKAIMHDVNRPAVIDTAHFLYDSDYETVIEDAKQILHDYSKDFSFEPEKLNFADYHIEGRYTEIPSVEKYEDYLKGNHKRPIVYFNRLSMIPNWSLSQKRNYCCIVDFSKDKSI